jgi:hypothetical protein
MSVGNLEQWSYHSVSPQKGVVYHIDRALPGGIRVAYVGDPSKKITFKQ